jgi:hypothetical protein
MLDRARENQGSVQEGAMFQNIQVEMCSVDKI